MVGEGDGDELIVEGPEVGSIRGKVAAQPEVEVQLKWPLRQYDPVPRMAANGDTYDLKHLNLEADQGLIRTSTDREIGVLDEKLFQALRSCMTGEHFQIDVWVPWEEWFAKQSDAEYLSINNRKIVILKVDLILFGLDQVRDRVATSLGGSKIYLQDPHMGLFEHPYANPQSLDLPELPVKFQMTIDRNPTEFRAGDASEAEDEVDKSREGNSIELTTSSLTLTRSSRHPLSISLLLRRKGTL